VLFDLVDFRSGRPKRCREMQGIFLSNVFSSVFDFSS